jgi:hypothetical protein
MEEKEKILSENFNEYFEAEVLMEDAQRIKEISKP